MTMLVWVVSVIELRCQFRLGIRDIHRLSPTWMPLAENGSMKPHNYKACQSLFGYAQRAHRRSEARYQLCGCRDPANFDMWRQMTIEHLIGQSQAAHIRKFKPLLTQCFPEPGQAEVEDFATSLDDLNTVTACRFCNAMTSQITTPKGMDLLIAEAAGPDDLLVQARQICSDILAAKRGPRANAKSITQFVLAYVGGNQSAGRCFFRPGLS